MNLKLIFVVIVLLLGDVLLSQDGYFSQFDKAKQLFNPSYTSFKRDFGADLLVRTQWGSSDGNSLKTFLFVDGKLKRINSYVGFDVYHDNLNDGNTQKLELNLRYAYQKALNRDFRLRVGAGIGYGNINHKANSYLFGDQFDLNGNVTGDSQEDIGELSQKGFLELNIGTVFFTDDGLELGFGIRHLNFPLLSRNANGVNRVNPFLTMFLGNRYHLSGSAYRPNSKMVYLIPSITWMNQAQFNLLQLGTDVEIEKVVLGGFFRFWPSKLDGTYGRGSSFTIKASLKTENFQMGYAYDLILSKAVASLASHEISIGYYLSELPTRAVRNSKRF